VSRPAKFRFRLYVAGGTANSARAIANLERICRVHLPGRHEIEIVDVFRESDRALTDGVLMTPMLFKIAPTPVRSILGTLSHTETVLQALELDTPVGPAPDRLPKRRSSLYEGKLRAIAKRALDDGNDEACDVLCSMLASVQQRVYRGLPELFRRLGPFYSVPLGSPPLSFEDDCVLEQAPTQAVRTPRRAVWRRRVDRRA